MKTWDNLKAILSVMWFPILLLALFLFLISRITGYQDTETTRVVLGITLGVALGFIADILKRSLDDYNRRRILQKGAVALLKNDAENIYRSAENYISAVASVDTAPQEFRDEIRKAIEIQLPPPLELRYWDRLNQNNDFLLLGSTKLFNKIFNALWEMEKINQLISLAVAKQDKQAYMFAKAIYDTFLKERHHEKFLRQFMTSKELKEFKENWKKTIE